jgi:hypothetical protein
VDCPVQCNRHPIREQQSSQSPASLGQDPKTELESIPTRADQLQFHELAASPPDNGEGYGKPMAIWLLELEPHVPPNTFPSANILRFAAATTHCTDWNNAESGRGHAILTSSDKIFTFGVKRHRNP